MKNDIIVKKMLNIVYKIENYCAGISYEEFKTNDMLIEACVFNLS